MTRLGRTRAIANRMLTTVAALLLVAAFGCDGDGGSATADGAVSGVDAGPAYYNVRRDLSAFFDVEGVDVQVGPPEGYIPEGATELQIEALARVNWYRWKAGLPTVGLNNAISEAAQMHCECYVVHLADYSEMSPHSEKSSWPEPCRGESATDRIAASGGSTGRGVTEIIAYLMTPTLAVDGWMETLYHRLPILDPTARECGYGDVIEGGGPINTMNFVLGDSAVDLEGVHFYPYDGQTQVPTQWDGYESPQPPPPPAGYPSGPIITMTLGRGGWMGETHELFDGDGQTVEHTYLDHYNDEYLSGWNTMAIYANEPLQSGMTYQVRFVINDSGAPRTFSWSFTTR